MLVATAALLLQTQPASADTLHVYASAGKACWYVVEGQKYSMEILPEVAANKARQFKRAELRARDDGSVRCPGVALLMLRDAGYEVTMVTFPERLVLAVPAGECRPVAEGVPVALAALPALTKQWNDEERLVGLQPDPAASSECVAAVLAGLEKLKKSRLGFVGNEMASDAQ